MAGTQKLRGRIALKRFKQPQESTPRTPFGQILGPVGAVAGVAIDAAVTVAPGPDKQARVALSDGAAFTSTSQGLRSSSISTSYP